MKRRIDYRTPCSASICGLTLAASIGLQLTVYAEQVGYGIDPAPLPTQIDTHSGGVLAEPSGSHGPDVGGFHAPWRNIAPSGWQGYGFPVQSYRWGWFGAERYYPRVVWHRGYYGDCCRWGYRRGY